MKFTSLLHAVITADQRHSRTSADEVPDALGALNETLAPRLILPFERTAGDEIQALTTDPSAVVDAIILLTRQGAWRIGIGLGGVDTPLPASTRAARGPAYLAAREGVETARRAPSAVSLVLDRGGAVGGEGYGVTDALLAESALVMLRALLLRRSTEGWVVSELVQSWLSGKQIAEQLQISPSSVSQRLSRAAYAESLRGRELATYLLARAMGTTRAEA